MNRAEPTFVEQPTRTSEETLPARLLVVPQPDGTTVVVGASLEDQHEARTQLIRVGLAGGALTLVLTSLVIWLMAGEALRPVERMRRDAAGVTAADLGTPTASARHRQTSWLDWRPPSTRCSIASTPHCSGSGA